MNLRLLLVLITVLSYVAIGVTWFIANPKEEVKEPTPPFFYTLAPEDLRNIKITVGDTADSWSLDVEERRWFFDNVEGIPVSLYRWGGITQLLGGPRTQRILATKIDDESKYGLDNPDSSITVTLRDESTLEMFLGNLTPDGANNYARVVGYPQLVLVDASWGQVLTRLVNEPPFPDWYYTIKGEIREILMFDENEIVRAYGFDRESESWFVCDIPLEAEPCTGRQQADTEALDTAMTHYGQPEILGVAVLGLLEGADYSPWGTVLDAPYIAIRLENRTETNVIEVTRLTMTFGDETDNGKSRYVLANETHDVIKVDSAWADRVLDLFFGELLLDNG
jgi:hypothetical protein